MTVPTGIVGTITRHVSRSVICTLRVVAMRTKDSNGRARLGPKTVRQPGGSHEGNSDALLKGIPMSSVRKGICEPVDISGRYKNPAASAAAETKADRSEGAHLLTTAIAHACPEC